MALGQLLPLTGPQCPFRGMRGGLLTKEWSRLAGSRKRWGFWGRELSYFSGAADSTCSCLLGVVCGGDILWWLTLSLCKIYISPRTKHEALRDAEGLEPLLLRVMIKSSGILCDTAQAVS